MGADTEGKWQPLPAGFKIPVASPDIFDPFDATRKISDTRGLFVIHAVLLYTGKILCFSGHAEDLFYAPIAYLYDPRVPSSTQLKAIPMPAGKDLFCCHCVQLSDGRILIIGGSQQDDLTGGTRTYHGSEGAKSIVVFDPAPGKETFSVPAGIGQLAQGRWYPTVVMMGDGRAIVLSGRRESGSYPGNPASIADAVEAISPRADSRVTLTNSGASAPRLPIYPGVHLAPDGNIYTTHTCWGQEVGEPPSFKLSVTATTSTWTAQSTNSPVQVQREEGMSVPLPVTKPRASSQGRFLIVGGGQARGREGVAGPTGIVVQLTDGIFTGHASGVDLKSSEILDTTVNPPTWTATPGPGLTQARVNGHCVLLPDATVAVIGGHDAYKWYASANESGVSVPTTTPSLKVELFKPGVGFSVGAAMAKPRMYHSVAVLLPDGRVWVAGGADPNDHEPWLKYPLLWKGRRYGTHALGATPPLLPGTPRKNGTDTEPLNRKDYQIYEPPYLHKGLPQPAITRISPGVQVVYGATFTITTPQAASIKVVAIMRPGAPTHHTDTEQRYVELDFAPPSGNDITVTMVPATDANLVTPGYYMVWIVDDKGIPCSNAKFIQVIHPPPLPPPVATGNSGVCIVATVSTGSAQDADVVFLRATRSEIATAGAAGRCFARAVNAAYYAWSPQFARWIAPRPPWRAAVRDIVVRPGSACIRAAKRAADRLPSRWRIPALIAMLTGEGLLALLALPVVAALVAASVLLRGQRG
jgi:hypothetical protein